MEKKWRTEGRGHIRWGWGENCRKNKGNEGFIIFLKRTKINWEWGTRREERMQGTDDNNARKRQKTEYKVCVCVCIRMWSACSR